MDNLMQRRIVAVIGIVVAFLGLCAFLWGMLKNDQILEMIGFFSIIIAYVLMLLVKKIREKGLAEKEQGSKTE